MGQKATMCYFGWCSDHSLQSAACHKVGNGVKIQSSVKNESTNKDEIQLGVDVIKNSSTHIC